MSWKTETRLYDLDPMAEIEITCRSCGRHYYEKAQGLVNQARLGKLYLDELERVLMCRVKTCRGPVRIAIVHDDLNEGFVGGMA